MAEDKTPWKRIYLDLKKSAMQSVITNSNNALQSVITFGMQSVITEIQSVITKMQSVITNTVSNYKNII